MCTVVRSSEWSRTWSLSMWADEPGGLQGRDRTLAESFNLSFDWTRHPVKWQRRGSISLPVTGLIFFTTDSSSTGSHSLEVAVKSSKCFPDRIFGVGLVFGLEIQNIIFIKEGNCLWKVNYWRKHVLHVYLNVMLLMLSEVSLSYATKCRLCWEVVWF